MGRFHQQHALKQGDVRACEGRSDLYHARMKRQMAEERAVRRHPEELSDPEFGGDGRDFPSPNGWLHLNQTVRHVWIRPHNG